MLPLTLAVLGAIATVSAQQRRPLNITITDNSPMLWYQPELITPELNTTRSGLASDSWNVTWSETPWTRWSPNRVGHGDSAHQTSRIGASVTFSWIGTGVDFLGHVEGPGQVEILLLQSTTKSKGTKRYLYDGRLASLYDLAWGWHKASMLVKNGTIYMTGLTYTTVIDTLQDSAEATLTVDVSARDGESINALVSSLQGNSTLGGKPWNAHNVVCSSDDPVYWPRMDTSDLDAWATMTVPDNASYFTFWGSMNEDHRQYSIEIIPTPPELPQGPQVFMGYSPWCTPDTMMYAGPLNPRERYEIRVVNLAEGRTTDIKRATFWIANATNAEGMPGTAWSTAAASGVTEPAESDAAGGQRGLNWAALLGITIGCVAGLAVAVYLIFLLNRRRQRCNDDREPFVIDENKHILADNARSPPLSPSSTRRSVQGRQAPPIHSYSSSQSSIGSTMPLASIHENSIYVTDTDAGTLTSPIVLMPPVYDPQWATTSSAGSGAPSMAPMSTGRSSGYTSDRLSPRLTQAEAMEIIQGPETEVSPSQWPREKSPRHNEDPQPSGGDGAERGSSETDSRHDRRTSSQVTALLSELWGSPLERNGSTWKPARGSQERSPKTSADSEERGDV